MPVLQWGLLFLLSLLLSLLFHSIHLPAALLLGPMITGILFSLRGISLKLPRCTFLGAQAILGCMIAQNLSGSLLTTLAANWVVVLAVLLVTLLSSTVVGWLLVRYSSLLAIPARGAHLPAVRRQWSRWRKTTAPISA